MTRHSRFSGNTTFGLVGVGLFLASMVAGHFFAKSFPQNAGLPIILVGFGLCSLMIAVGQLVTGYSWQNLADRNEGPHRNENPKRFWSSIALNVTVCLVVCAFAFYRYRAR